MFPSRRGFLIKAKAILTAIAITGVIAGQAQADTQHYVPQNPQGYKERVAVFEKRKDHVFDVRRFFENHPKLANTQAGRNALWQHKKLLRWTEEVLTSLNDTRYIHLFSNEQLREQAKEEVANGGTYSVRHGGCSSRLQSLSQEITRRQFGPHGTYWWADSIIRRESGYCPGAVNTTYSDPSQQASCIAQFIPAVHRWVNYKRCKSDPWYSVAIFVKLSKGGRYTSPWNL